MAGFLETSTGLFSPRSISKGLSLSSADSMQGMSANDLYAQFTRDQWANYVNTFVPIENQLIKYATDATLPGQEMAKASEDVNAAYTQQAGATARRLRGLGVELSPEEQAAQQKQYGLSKSLADVQAQNVAGDLTRQRQQSILGNPAPQ
jgi:hypothetical protein